MCKLDQRVACRARKNCTRKENDGAARRECHVGEDDAGEGRVSDRIADEALPLVYAERTYGSGGNGEDDAAESDDLECVVHQNVHHRYSLTR